MTVESLTARNDYVGTGLVDEYDFTFRIESAADLRVIVSDDEDVESVLVLTTDYTVDGAGEEGGGSITLVAGDLASGYRLSIRQAPALLQETQLRGQTALHNEVLEDALDRSMRCIQRLSDDQSRSLRLPETESGTTTKTLLPRDRAGKLLKFDPSTSAPIAIDPGDVNLAIPADDSVDTDVMQDGAATNAKLADMAQSTIKGRAAAAGTGDPTDLTAAQATAILSAMVGDSGAGGTKGLVPAPAAGDGAARKLLDASGLWMSMATLRDLLGLHNYCSNPDAEVDVTGWAAYADAAGTEPVDGTGGTPTITWTRTTSSPIAGTASFLMTKPASNCQGQGVSIDFDVPGGMQGHLVVIEFLAVLASGGAGLADPLIGNSADMVVSVYDKTNAALVSVGGGFISALQKSGGMYPGAPQRLVFRAAANSTAYRLCIHWRSTYATAATFKFDDFIVRPVKPHDAGLLQVHSIEIGTANSTASATYVATNVTAKLLRRLRDAGSKVRVRVSATVGASAAATVKFTLFRSINGGAAVDITPVGVDSLMGVVVAASTDAMPMSFEFTDAPAVGQEVQYTVYMLTSAGTAYLGRRGSDTTIDSNQHITAEEIAVNL